MSRRSLDRSCKRRRSAASGLEIRGPSKRARVDTTTAPSYFETLVSDVKDTVMRFSSERPMSKKWEDYMQLTEVHNYLAEDHPLHAAAKARFSVLMACDSYPYERRGLLVHGKAQKAVIDFRNTAHVLRDLITEVYIYQTAFPPSWKQTLRYGVPNLKSLSLNSANMTNMFPLEVILNAHPNRLEALEMTWKTCTKKQIRCMEKNLGGLRRLSVMFEEVEASFEGVWKKVGSTLEEMAVLEMGRPDEARIKNYRQLALDDFRKYCPHISKLDFELCPADVRDNLVDFFVSYGKQLKVLILIRCGLGAEQLGKICAACPSVRVDLAEYRGLTVNSLIATGKNASLVNFGCNTFEKFDVHVLRELGDAIVNLTGFCVSAYSHNVVEGIGHLFKLPKPELTFARIENEKGDKNASVLDIIGSRFPTLEQVEITEICPSISDLKKLGPVCPKVKELILLNIQDGAGTKKSKKMCLCKPKDPANNNNNNNNNNNANDQNKADEAKLEKSILKNITEFVKVLRKFPALDEIDYSCVNFSGDKSERIEGVEPLLKQSGGRRTCFTICGNHYS